MNIRIVIWSVLLHGFLCYTLASDEEETRGVKSFWDILQDVNIKHRNDEDLDDVFETLIGDTLVLFKTFVKTYKKQYPTEHEEWNRYKIFVSNLPRIIELSVNERATAWYRVTEFTDLTEEEFKTHLGYVEHHNIGLDDITFPLSQNKMVVWDLERDWRDRNAVSPVKDQGECGSSWAFSVAGTIEGQWSIRTGDLVELSAQNIVDCDLANYRCQGGSTFQAYDAVRKLGGLEMENDYPYVGEAGTCLAYNTTADKAQIKKGLKVPQSERIIAQWLYKHGPLSAGINAAALRYYGGGIAQPLKSSCSPDRLNQAVLIVGLGSTSLDGSSERKRYWIVKNSWGTNWGEDGYIRLYRGEGTCGIDRAVSTAILDKA